MGLEVPSHVLIFLEIDKEVACSTDLHLGVLLFEKILFQFTVKNIHKLVSSIIGFSH